MSSPSFATLLDWLEGRLDRDTAGPMADQVGRGDRRTRSAVRWLQEFLGTARSFPAPEPPPAVRQHLRQHFRRWCKAQEALRAEPLVLEAAVLFDSRQDLALVGVRGGEDSDEAYHLAYTTAVGDLVVDVRKVAYGRVRLDGQVLPGDPEAAPVFTAEVTGPGFRARTVDGDDLGRFTLDDVPVGVCRLEVTNGEVTLRAALSLTS